MKRIVSLSLVVFMLILCLMTTTFAYQTVGLDNFQKDLTYTQDIFTDNHPSDWFHKNVVSVYEYGLMQGVGNNLFLPNGNVTIATAITMAVRINCIYTDGGLPEFETAPETAWYTPYLQSALRRGIITEEFQDYNAPATRAQFARILATSIDDVDLQPINLVEDGAIPDVDMNADYADAVYLLYRAGVLSGSDADGTFNPDSTISRAEVAAIVTRMVEPTLRKTIELSGEY